MCLTAQDLNTRTELPRGLLNVKRGKRKRDDDLESLDREVCDPCG